MKVARVPWMALAMVLLLAGLWAGVVRLGWAWSPLLPTLPMAHGPLMIGGFLGVLIGLERAIGLGRRAAYFVPAAAGVGAVLAASGSGGNIGPLLITLASAGLVMVMAAIWRLQPALYTVVLVLGAMLWAVGNTAWLLGATIPSVTMAWAGFLVLTIAAERLELSRLLRLSRWAVALFVAVVTLVITGALVALVHFESGVRLTALGWLGLGGWLLRFDIASRRVRAGGQARYMAFALLVGYGWLAAGGVIGALLPVGRAGPVYDAFLHTVLVGFVFSMIFAHILIILPAVLGVDVLFRPRFYAHLWLLQGALALRVAGDLGLWWPARMWGGLLTAVVMVVFLVNTLSGVRLRPRLPVSAPVRAQSAGQ